MTRGLMEKQHTKRERTQFSIVIDDALANEIQTVLERSTGLTKTHLGRIALREKCRELKTRLDSGEEIFLGV